MNSTFKSIGKVFLAAPMVLMLGCATTQDEDGGASSVQVKQELQGEVSLKKDREELEALRKNIPAEKQIANDEMALTTQLIVESKIKPSDLQSQFQVLVQKRRGAHQKKVKELRESFRRLEVQARNDFKTKQDEKRDEFRSRKRDRDVTKKFYDELNRERLDFQSKERERRSDFESDISGQVKDFDAYIKERTKEFNEQVQMYSKRYHEVRKERAANENKTEANVAIDPRANAKAVTEQLRELKAGDEGQ